MKKTNSLSKIISAQVVMASIVDMLSPEQRKELNENIQNRIGAISYDGQLDDHTKSEVLSEVALMMSKLK